MKFTLEIDLDNAAFDSADFGSERFGPSIAYVLKTVAQRLDNLGSVGDMRASIRDVNGNTCGHWQIV
jgi:hypothetical protein